jgi:hypothetical protein
VFNDVLADDYESNRLLLSANPLMSIAMTCELLEYIANTRKRYENECIKIKKELLGLGNKLNDKI